MESGGSRMAKDLLAGAAGGVAQVLMGESALKTYDRQPDKHDS